MSQFILNYPETLPDLLKTSQDKLHKDMQFIIAGKLYEMGKLSCGKAAEIAGVSRIDFLNRLGDYGFHAFNLDEQQIDIEIQAAKDISS